MLHKTSGIILHTTKYSETSLIAKIYTRNFGLQSYIINGVRSKKSKNKATLFQPLALVDMVVSNSEKGNLQRISEINISHPYTTIPYDIIKSSIAIFLNEVLYKALKEEYNDEDLYKYIQNSLLILDLNTYNCSNFHIHFMLQLSRYLGFYPQGKFTSDTSLFDLQEGSFINYLPNHSNYLTANHSVLLNNFLISSYESLHLLKIDKQERKNVLKSIIVFYQLHLASFGEIKSYEILEEVIA
jgi:DNA repair protein RecO (recombination protein O)